MAQSSRSSAIILSDSTWLMRTSSSSQRELTAERRTARVDWSRARVAAAEEDIFSRAAARDLERWQRKASAPDTPAAAAAARQAPGGESSPQRLMRAERRVASKGGTSCDIFLLVRYTTELCKQ
jgi:hypothetical protein